MTNRLTWEQYALKLAIVAAERSEDPYLKVGSCVLRHDHSIAGVGYNGTAPNIAINWSDRDHRRLRVVHAEVNSLAYTRPNECYLLASTLLPCNNCLTQIARYGIKKIVFKDVYERDQTTIDLAEEFQIQLIRLTQI